MKKKRLKIYIEKRNFFYSLTIFPVTPDQSLQIHASSSNWAKENVPPMKSLKENVQ